MELTTILNRCHRFRGFLYEHAHFSTDKKRVNFGGRYGQRCPTRFAHADTTMEPKRRPGVAEVPHRDLFQRPQSRPSPALPGYSTPFILKASCKSELPSHR